MRQRQLGQVRAQAVGGGPYGLLGRPPHHLAGGQALDRVGRELGLHADDHTSDGDSALTAVATPEASPPPPTGTSTAATSGASATISSPIVPCPAMTSRWSNGGITVMPRLPAVPRVRGSRSAIGHQMHLGAERPDRVDLDRAETSGMTTTHGMPSRRAAYATAWPWLPDECVTTPARPRLVRQAGQRVHRAAQLERAGRLQALRLEPQPGPGRRAQRAECAPRPRRCWRRPRGCRRG